MIAPVEFDRHYHINDLPGRARPRDRQPQDDSQQLVSRQLELVREVVGQHPVAAIAVGAAVGLAAALLIKRRTS